MKFHWQLNGHFPPNGIIGDCYRTVIGCLLDLPPDKVPHFLDDGGKIADSDAVRSRTLAWLATHGLTMLDMPFPGTYELETVLDTVAKINGNDILYILMGLSVTRCGHVVICRGRDILWDPAGSGGIVGPTEDGHYWLTFLMPLSMRWSGALADPSPTLL